MPTTPVSQIAAAIFECVERAVYEGRIAGGMIILAADGLRVKLAQEEGDEVHDTEFPLPVSEIAIIDPGMYHEYAAALVAGGVQLLDTQQKDRQGPIGIVR